MLTPFLRRACILVAATCAAIALMACQSGSKTDGDSDTPITEPAVAADPYAIDWEALELVLGQYPHSAPFLQQPGVAARLTRLLGADGYALALQNLEVSGPLDIEGSTYYITGNRQHMGGIEAAAIALDEASNTVRVWLLHQSQAQVFAEPQASFAWPRDVRIMIDNSTP